MRLLIVGGAGHVGSIIRPAMEAQHSVHYLDIKPVPGAEDRTTVGSVTERDAVRSAIRESDPEAVVYLAMGALEDKPDGPDRIQSMFDVNVQGVYRVLRSALRAGVRRFVHASSMSVYRLQEDLPPFTEECEPNAWDPYGLSKRLGEHIYHSASLNYPEAIFVGLRLVHPLNEAQHQEMLTGDLPFSGAFPLAPGDTQRLFLAALETSQPGVHMLQTSGDIEGQRYPNSAAEALLGWQAQGK